MAPKRGRKQQVQQDESSSSSDEEDTTTSSKSAKIATVVKKGAAVVDPYSGLVSNGTVFADSEGVWNAMLNQTNIAQNNNKFYVVQLIQHGGSYTVFTRWGRVGEKGQSKSSSFNNINSAKAEFKKKFKEKSANNWEDRDDFVPKAGKYTLISISYEEEEEKEEDEEKEEEKEGQTDKGKEVERKKIESKLDSRLQELIKLISNVNTMTETMKEFEIDLKRMPLGKLSKAQIKAGYEVLKELAEVINSGTRGELADLSSEFYTKIPHDFGRRLPPVIDTAEKVKKKMEMLEALADMEIASKLLSQSDKEQQLHPLDSAYASLKTDLVPLDHNSEEFILCKDYVETTHAPTHSAYTLEVLDVFKVSREGEVDRFAPSKSLGNRRLLWHGSRTTNFMGILSQGLRIAPPEAPATGYMFGKGVYFADLVSKSANYCFTNPSNNVGCLLLADVALGDMFELTHSLYVEKGKNLPQGKSSTWGKGKTVPDDGSWRKHPQDIDLTIPIGKPSPSKDVPNSTLLYNEFIVYDVAQVNLKYLLKVKFNYKSRSNW